MNVSLIICSNCKKVCDTIPEDTVPGDASAVSDCCRAAIIAADLPGAEIAQVYGGKDDGAIVLHVPSRRGA